MVHFTILRVKSCPDKKKLIWRKISFLGKQILIIDLCRRIWSIFIYLLSHAIILPLLFLQRLAILRASQTVDQQLEFERLFKGVWADNADIVSVQYSGTGALKTDFTRTGKRTYLGAMNDLSNSVIRYYKNNFLDGFRQVRIPIVPSSINPFSVKS